MKTERPVFNRQAHPEMSYKQYQIYHRREYQAWYRKNHNHKPRSSPAHQNGSNVEPVALTSCPCCSARFYAARGSV